MNTADIVYTNAVVQILISASVQKMLRLNDELMCHVAEYFDDNRSLIALRRGCRLLQKMLTMARFPEWVNVSTAAPEEWTAATRIKVAVIGDASIVRVPSGIVAVCVYGNIGVLELPNGLQELSLHGQYTPQYLAIPCSTHTAKFDQWAGAVLPASIRDLYAGRKLGLSNITRLVELPMNSELRVLRLSGIVQPPALLPPCLRVLDLSGTLYNEELDLPKTLREFHSSPTFNAPITLPNGMRIVMFGRQYNQNTLVPESVERLTFGERFRSNFNLPVAIRRLHIANHALYGTEILDIATSGKLSVLDLNDHYNHGIITPTRLHHLRLGCAFNSSLALNRGLHVLDLRYCGSFNRPIVLPDTLEEAYFGSSYNQPTVLPIGMIRVSFGRDFTHAIRIPDMCVYLKFSGAYPHPIATGPNLRTLIVGDCQHITEIIISEGLRILRISGVASDHLRLHIPSTLRRLHLEGMHYSKPLQFPRGLHALGIPEYYTEPLVLPRRLRILNMANYKHKRVSILPQSLHWLVIPPVAMRRCWPSRCRVRYDSPD